MALGSQDSQLSIAAAIENPAHPALGQDAGAIAGVNPLGVNVIAKWPNQVDVAIDFSSPEGRHRCAHHCTANLIPLVIATNRSIRRTIAAIHQSAKKIPICWAPNMSLAVNLTMRLAQQAAKKALKNVPARRRCRNYRNAIIAIKKIAPAVPPSVRPVDR